MQGIGDGDFVPFSKLVQQVAHCISHSSVWAVQGQIENVWEVHFKLHHSSVRILAQLIEGEHPASICLHDGVCGSIPRVRKAKVPQHYPEFRAFLANRGHYNNKSLRNRDGGERVTRMEQQYLLVNSVAFNSYAPYWNLPEESLIGQNQMSWWKTGLKGPKFPTKSLISVAS
jgi:hypothetical protein